MKKKLLFFILAVMLTIAGCSKITKITDSITNPSAREIYHRDAKDLMLYEQWDKAYAAALTDSLQVPLPYVENGKFRKNSIAAYSYILEGSEGEVLEATVVRDSAHHKVFIDLFEYTAQGYRHVDALKPDMQSVEFPIEKSGKYKFVIQPEINAQTDFAIVLSKKPRYGFPVAGKGNAAIESFWGYERDGGRRKHEGVDIFAARGTPVVAVADGYISNTGDRGLGGKQVWQRVGTFGNSIYYAHLDGIVAVAGTKVRKGDTLGFVGSTGNAKGGRPHLHLGIYRNGAVDPLPFIFNIPKPKIEKKGVSPKFAVAPLKIKSATANLRLAPTTSSAVVGKLQKNEIIKLLGEHQEWLHIQTTAGQKAFLHKSLVSSS